MDPAADPVPLRHRVAGMILSPRATFRLIAAAPRWADVLILTFLVSAASGAAFLQTEVGQLALLDQWERTAVAFGQPVDDAQYAALAEASRSGAAYAVVTSLVGGPVLVLALSLLLHGAFRLAGGAATYRQVFAVVVHAEVLLALRQVIAAPVNYARETMSSPTTASLFFTMLDESSPVARFFGVIDLFVLWWIVVLAVGMSVLYHRRARTLAAVFVGVYVALALVLALVMTVAGGAA
jgi:hypothetical protein